MSSPLLAIPALGVLALSALPLLPHYPPIEIETQNPAVIASIERRPPVAFVASVESEVAPDPTPTPPPSPRPLAASSGDIRSIITRWANHYGMSPDWLIRVADCESDFNPSIVNYNYYSEWGQGHPTGLFQFLPKTFSVNAARIGLVGANIWNPEHQSQVASWMFANGQSSQWECK